MYLVSAEYGVRADYIQPAVDMMKYVRYGDWTRLDIYYGILTILTPRYAFGFVWLNKPPASGVSLELL